MLSDCVHHFCDVSLHQLLFESNENSHLNIRLKRVVIVTHLFLFVPVRIYTTAVTTGDTQGKFDRSHILHLQLLVESPRI